MLVEYSCEGHLATIRLNRPDRLNAIDREMQAALREAWLRYEADDDAWLAILTGNGRAFCAGADKSWFADAQRGEDSLGAFLDGTLRDPYWSGNIAKPVIAAVNGFAIGAGFDLVLRADLRVAAEDASFRMPEVDRGNVMILWDNLPYAVTAEIVTGAAFTAARAHQVGMVNRLAPAGGALESALAWADELMSKPPLVLRQALALLRRIRNANAVPDQRSLRDQATAVSKQLMQTDDWRAAVAALLGKTTPTFRGR